LAEPLAEKQAAHTGMVRPCSCPTSDKMLGRGTKD
jgi:hypothetical protein